MKIDLSKHTCEVCGEPAELYLLFCCTTFHSVTYLCWDHIERAGKLTDALQAAAKDAKEEGLSPR